MTRWLAVAGNALRAVVVLLIAATVPAYAHAATFYLDVKGQTDANCGAGASPSTAWRSLREQAHCIRPGDTVLLRAGSYASESDIFWNNKGGIILRGAPGRPITLRAFAAGSPDRYPVRFLGEFYVTAEHLVIDGVEFTREPGDTTRNLLMVLAGQDIRIRNSSIHGLAEDYCETAEYCATVQLRDCVHLDGSNRSAGSVTIEGSEIYNCRQDAIDNTGREGVTVRGSSISRALRVQLKGGATGTTFIGNRFHHLQMGIVSGGMNCIADLQGYCGSPRQLEIDPPLRFQASGIVIADNDFSDLAIGPVMDATGWTGVEFKGNKVVRGNHANDSRGLIEVSKPDTGYGVSAYFDQHVLDYCATKPTPTQCVSDGVTRNGRHYWRVASKTGGLKAYHNRLAGRSSLVAILDGVGNSEICMSDNEYGSDAPFVLMDSSRRDPRRDLAACAPSR